MTDKNRRFFVVVPPEFAGIRADKALAKLLPAHSRTTIQQWLKQGRVRVDGQPPPPKFSPAGGETVEISPPEPPSSECPAQPMDFEILDADADLLVIDKPAGLVVHPGAGRADNTLLNGLLHFDESLRTLPRAGIVHRLDKDTSGLLVVARNEAARRHLTGQLQDHSMQRRYLAVVNGVMVAGERIDQPIGRHRHERLRMCVTASGKPAVTHIRVARKFRRHCLVRAELETGRTHQIRVHLSWRGFPVVGDPLYGGRAGRALPPKSGDALAAALRRFDRQALHAECLRLRHPRTGEPRQWRRPPPADFNDLVEQLEADWRGR